MSDVREKMLPRNIFLEHVNAEIAVLLIHGFTGTTHEFQGLAKYLHKQGHTVYAPLLHGHGTTPEEMEKTSWVDWWMSARAGYQFLYQNGYKKIVVVGLSMGGLLALKLAQYLPVLGVVTLCAPFKVKDKRLKLVKYIKRFMPYLKRTSQKAEHIERELFVYDKTPLVCIESLANLMKNVRQILPKIKRPALIVQALQDETVDPASGEMIYQRIGSEQKQLVTFEKSSHIITLDIEREELHQLLHSFLKQLNNTKEKKLQEVEAFS